MYNTDIFGGLLLDTQFLSFPFSMFTPSSQLRQRLRVYLQVSISTPTVTIGFTFGQDFPQQGMLATGIFKKKRHEIN